MEHVGSRLWSLRLRSKHMLKGTPGALGFVVCHWLEACFSEGVAFIIKLILVFTILFTMITKVDNTAFYCGKP